MAQSEQDGGSVVERIVEVLSGRLKAGEYLPGTKIPSEAELCTELGVGRNSVRSAVEVLERKGQVFSRKGSGVFVRHTTGEILRDETKRSSTSWWGSGHSMWELDLEGRELAIDSMTRERGVAPDAVAAILDDDQVWIRFRRYLVEKRPVLLSTSYIPCDIADGTRITETDTGPGGVLARLVDAGHAPSGARWQVRQRFAGAREAELLEVPRNFQLLVMARIHYDANGRAVEISELVMDPTVFILQFDSQI